VLHVALAFNPSHLEIVNPVVEGSWRARQHRRKDHDGSTVLPILLHGDAHSPAGVVMETLAMSQTRGYRTAARYTYHQQPDRFHAVRFARYPLQHLLQRCGEMIDAPISM